MSFFGFKSAKEVEEEKRKAAEAARQVAEEEKKKAIEAEKQKAKEEKDKAVEAEKEAVLRRQQTELANLAKGSQINITIPYFDVFDPRFENYAVPVAIHGSLIYAVDDIQKFNTLNKSQNINDGVFANKIKDQVQKSIKGVVANAPFEHNIQVLQLERKILEISELVKRLVTPQIEASMGINIRSIDISQIMVDKTSLGYRELKEVTADLEREALHTRSALNLDAMKRQQEMTLGGQEELQRIQLENQRETMRVQREEMQRAARLQTETNFLGAHQANLGAEVAKTQSLFGQQQTTAMPQMPGLGGMPQMPGMPPMVQYMVGINGQPMGPFNWNQLQQLVQNGQLTQQSQVWKQGMAAWAMAGQVQELLPLFLSQAAAMGGMPPMM